MRDGPRDEEKRYEGGRGRRVGALLNYFGACYRSSVRSIRQEQVIGESRRKELSMIRFLSLTNTSLL